MQYFSKEQISRLKLLVVMTISIICLTGCASVGGSLGSSSTSPAASESKSTCPAPGTEESFAKVMSSGFAKSYAGCDILVKGDFLLGNTQNATAWTKTNYTTFQTVAKGSKGTTIAGINMGFITAIPNDKADLVFSLNPGDPIIMKGGTFIREMTGGYFEVVFMATSIERDK